MREKPAVSHGRRRHVATYGRFFNRRAEGRRRLNIGRLRAKHTSSRTRLFPRALASTVPRQIPWAGPRSAYVYRLSAHVEPPWPDVRRLGQARWHCVPCTPVGERSGMGAGAVFRIMLVRVHAGVQGIAG